MRWFYNLSILKKIVASFLVTCGLTGVVGYLGVTGMAKINEMLDALATRQMNGLAAAKGGAV